MGHSFYKNLPYTRALLSAKATQPPKRTFLLRKIFTDYIAYHIAYMGKNKHLKTVIQSDIAALKLRRKVLQNKKKQNTRRAFL